SHRSRWSTQVMGNVVKHLLQRRNGGAQVSGARLDVPLELMGVFPQLFLRREQRPFGLLAQFHLMPRLVERSFRPAAGAMQHFNQHDPDRSREQVAENEQFGQRMLATLGSRPANEKIVGEKK